jgi:hypothetical protein
VSDPLKGPEPTCHHCGQPISLHTAFHDEPPADHGLTEGEFDFPTSGLYCPHKPPPTSKLVIEISFEPDADVLGTCEALWEWITEMLPDDIADEVYSLDGWDLQGPDAVKLYLPRDD